MTDGVSRSPSKSLVESLNKRLLRFNTETLRVNGRNHDGWPYGVSVSQYEVHTFALRYRDEKRPNS